MAPPRVTPIKRAEKRQETRAEKTQQREETREQKQGTREQRCLCSRTTTRGTTGATRCHQCHSH
jgi:hypothetical protein